MKNKENITQREITSQYKKMQYEHYCCSSYYKDSVLMCKIKLPRLVEYVE